MVDVKEIKSVKLTPFTKMSASIYGILGFNCSCSGVNSPCDSTSYRGYASQFGQFNLVTGLGIPLIITLYQ